MPRKTPQDVVKVPAIRTRQAGVRVYAFFAPGALISEIADISRIDRDEHGELEGFQRREIKNHVKEIVEYLENGDVLFPNAIILAFSEEPKFERTRGVKKGSTALSSEPGYLELARQPEGTRTAWIVDGQQRSLAMRQQRSTFPVPVVGFVSDETHVHREQFILVNKARPLPRRLIQELLPVTQSVLLPRSLEAKRVPSELCDALNRDPASPFCGLIRQPSQAKANGALVMDTAITSMIYRSFEDPRGALAQLKDLQRDTGNSEEMFDLLVAYWSAVKEVFPAGWGLKPEKSRLMHSVGIAAMGSLMDRLALAMPAKKGRKGYFSRELRRIEKDCAWTAGQWPLINRPWNELQNTTADVRLLESTLVQMYAKSLQA